MSFILEKRNAKAHRNSGGRNKDDPVARFKDPGKAALYVSFVSVSTSPSNRRGSSQPDLRLSSKGDKAVFFIIELQAINRQSQSERDAEAPSDIQQLASGCFSFETAIVGWADWRFYSLCKISEDQSHQWLYSFPEFIAKKPGSFYTATFVFTLQKIADQDLGKFLDAGAFTFSANGPVGSDDHSLIRPGRLYTTRRTSSRHTLV
jgi:hypothetical protein